MEKLLFLSVIILVSASASAQQWVTYNGYEGPGKGKHIVLISGDEEYRSEEALPMLAQILAVKYGFSCTVLFAIDPATGAIDPMYQGNIPGLRQLAGADLMLIFTRFRELPDSQMRYIDNYINAARPIIGLRTSTHAFAYAKDTISPFAKYSFNSKIKGWEGGFGRRILGETWVAHHGKHKIEGARVLVNGIELNEKNPLLNGVKDIWVPSDVYTVRKPAGDYNVLLYGQVTKGMTADAPVNLDKSIMPVAWTKSYSGASGKKGKVFTTTMGSSVDLLNEDLRRLIVNACFWATGLEKQIPERADVGFIKEYKPTFFGFGSFKKGGFPAEYMIK